MFNFEGDSVHRSSSPAHAEIYWQDTNTTVSVFHQSSPPGQHRGKTALIIWQNGRGAYLQPDTFFLSNFFAQSNFPHIFVLGNDSPLELVGTCVLAANVVTNFLLVSLCFSFYYQV